MNEFRRKFMLSFNMTEKKKQAENELIKKNNNIIKDINVMLTEGHNYTRLSS